MSRRVLVVGAGVAGLALARALSDRGISCVVVEDRPGPAVSGLALNLPGNAVRALAVLGVDLAATGLGHPVRRREYRSARDRLLFAVDEDAFWADVGRSVCLRRDVLIGRLLDGLAPGTVRWGTRVLSVVPRGDVVMVRTSHGPPTGHDAVVGADGVHSAVRAAVDVDAVLAPAAMGGTSWRFVVPDPGVACWTVWTGREGTILLIPVDGGRVYGYASTTRGGAAEADPSWLTTTFSGFPGPVAAAVGRALMPGSGLLHSRVEEVRARRWSAGRVTVIGDAAHAMGPVWAQGAALAVEDGLVLADLLADAADWSGVGTLFEERRRPRVAHVASSTARMSRLARLPLWLRDLVAPVAGPASYRAAYAPLRSPVR